MGNIFEVEKVEKQAPVEETRYPAVRFWVIQPGIMAGSPF